MPKHIVKGVGMMQRHQVQYEPGEPGALEACVMAWDEALPVAQPDDMPGDALDRHNAGRCRAILATVGLDALMEGKGAVSLGPLREKGLDEDSAQWIAAHWLGAYNQMMAHRRDLVAGDASPSTIGMMLMHAQEMGRLQERMWWRRGIDPDTGKRREALALGKRAQEKARPKATEARRIQAQDTRPDWHDSATLEAQEIRRRHPSYSRWRIAGMLHDKFGISQNRCDKVLRANGIE